MMAGVLSEMIDAENIVLVGCFVDKNATPDGKEGAHMMIGVSDLPFKKSTRESYRSKEFHLIETTVPHQNSDIATTNLVPGKTKCYPIV
jgi:hypothetical protein